MQYAQEISTAAPVAPLNLACVEGEVDMVQRQMDALKAEVNDLRRRDETLNFYMSRLDEELRLAARLQRDFLPKELPKIGPIRFHSLFRPAGYVSGDLYDVMRLDGNKIGFYMADAVGHGVPAALLTMFLKHALQIREGSGWDPNARLLEPSESLAKLNQLLLEQDLSHSTFATAIYGMIDVQTLELKLARAGHPHPIIIRADGKTESLEPNGCLLGILPDEEFEPCVAQLNAGDRVLLYTDGVETALWEDYSSEEGGHRWLDELLSHRDMPADQLLIEFAKHLDQETGSLQAKDDITLLLMEVER